MKKLIATFFISLATLLPSLGLMSAQLVHAQADPKGNICKGIGGCTEPAGSKTVNDIVETVINILSFVIGIAGVIMVIVGGFKYVISQGDSNSINSAKNTILYALVGLVVAAMAQVIVRFVLNKV
ncbi:MAG: hypothetical protein AAB459_03865 [Patescibacteria group bacterium]